MADIYLRTLHAKKIYFILKLDYEIKWRLYKQRIQKKLKKIPEANSIVL